MKKNYYLFITVLLFTSLIYVKSYSQDSIDVKVCETYKSLYETILNGDAASIEKTAWISEFSLIENSLVTIYPQKAPMNGYKVVILITNLEKGEKKKAYKNNSILGFVLKGCKNVNEEYSTLINSSCYFVADNAEDARDVAKNGITEVIDDKYLIEGNLVQIYSNICKDRETPKPKPVKKPAVYLYPESNMQIKVKLSVNGYLTSTEPLYNDGWLVNASPEGLIDNKYDYLFYEVQLNKINLPDEGWVVEFSQLEKWFDEKPIEFGLNQKEKAQFKEYWLKDLKQSNYYEVKLLDEKFLSENMNLIITPEPQTILRLNFYFKPLNEKITLKEPEIQKKERIGFTVVEWGGINEGDKVLIQ